MGEYVAASFSFETPVTDHPWRAFLVCYGSGTANGRRTRGERAVCAVSPGVRSP